MESEWRAAYTPMMKPMPYDVYRLKDLHGIDHSGNREMLSEMYATRKEAEAKAAELNGKDERK